MKTLPDGTMITYWDVSLPMKKNEFGQVIDVGETIPAEIYFKNNPHMIEHMMYPTRELVRVELPKPKGKVSKSFLFFPASSLVLGALGGVGGYYIAIEMLKLTSQILIGLSTSVAPILSLIIFAITVYAYIDANSKGQYDIDLPRENAGNENELSL